MLVLDGAEVATATMCDTRHCPVCTCPHDELDRTTKAYPYRHTEEVKAQVEAARREHLDDRGQVKVNHLSKVLISYTILYPISYTISYIFIEGYRIQYRIRHRIRYRIRCHVLTNLFSG